ncbi:2-oxo-4-hydroxy-4-carboxy-5-ureidoimidazoline decarboxylase [Paenibacillus crassostreae]|uniref:2-oxo-4-hydroxy-4-carboxy-5-ureidoimidazoline decarboxylase n=1 Tax=Paenibacillus crassostreae TaxID=1763538 RepID=A0A167B4U2_9BACL|nr:2-oxo-4-hydroxy-4-carboxy-5-ureidoimidazoline decarboxylase [Paenibacillus crassostreae]AOZ93168.1 OHCU decarboxylase [Paenibacillus crassostreae]OAB71741.1 OHCU decarboxylase [Paenibacillus crassostreae]
MTNSISSVTLDEVNGMSQEEFVQSLGGIFEHSPWVAERAYRHIPFRSIEQLHQVLLETARSSEQSQIKRLLRSHPDLATRMEVTPLSAAEQQGAGLDLLTAEEFNILTDLNTTYMEKFQFPFILAVRGKNKDDIINAITERLNHSEQEEWMQALIEIGKITKFRLQDLIVQDSTKS